ncbi:M23 family metallopeptidase [Streptomyces prasinus]|uniref:M23 family metallopeptidase n=1 Tax=Streptomyces prasinus TaxID=67345 RepID=UPI001F0A8288|nr:M23 family metallopeptidase [Streptomyces prasinus]
MPVEPAGSTPPPDDVTDESPGHRPPDREPPSTTPAASGTRPPRRRRGPGPLALVVVSTMVVIVGVSGFLALTGVLSPELSEGPGPAPQSVSNVDASYVPWLRKAAEACEVVTPSLLAAQIDQLSGWDNDTASLSEQGIARFTDAQWRTWGRDDDANGRSSPLDQSDAVMALGRYDCSLAEEVTDLRTKGTVNGNLVDLTLAAYTVGTDEVARAGRVPAGARPFLEKVRERLPQYEALVRQNPDAADGRKASAILIPPAGTLPVTSPFGSREHPLTGVTKLHTGVDFGAPQGAPVFATRDGRVTFAAMTSAYGNRVVIDHGTIAGKRLETTYSHLSALQITAGQTVTAGTPVGLVGSTGLSTGPHLHFEVLLDGQYMDPMPWLSTAP